MNEILNILLKRFLPFKLVGSNAGRGAELFYRIKDSYDDTLFTIKEYYNPEGVPHFDFIDFSTDKKIELCNLTLEDIISKIMTIPIEWIYKMK